jgi:hypothetical protein
MKKDSSGSYATATKSSEISSTANRQTSFTNIKNFLSTKTSSPSYILRSRTREFLIPEFMKTQKNPIELDIELIKTKKSLGYSFGRESRNNNIKRNDYTSKTFQNSETIGHMKQSKNGLNPGFTFDKAGTEFGATYGTRNYNLLTRDS